jgi:hypothetical protein
MEPDRTNGMIGAAIASLRSLRSAESEWQTRWAVTSKE